FVLYTFFTLHQPSHIYTLSLHDALPIYLRERRSVLLVLLFALSTASIAVFYKHGLNAGYAIVTVYFYLKLIQCTFYVGLTAHRKDRKSTRLNSSHVANSYAVFCLKKKKI